MIIPENKISYDIRGCAFKIHNTLGPGLFESVYEFAMTCELMNLGYKVVNQVCVPVVYNDVKLDKGFKADILVDDLVFVEIKSVETLLNVHYKQLLTYLKLSGKKLGILINFNSDSLIDKQSIIRIVNNL